jgi:hypothetical protein
MKTAVIRSLVLVAFLVILTPTLYSQDEQKPEDSTCLPGQGCDWLTPEAKRLEALAAKDIYPTFSLTLSSGTRNKVISEYRVGDDMWITIIMANLTNHDIDCTMEDAGGYDRMFDYEAIDEDGKPVERRHQGTESYHHGGGIGAGGHVPHEFLLNRVFKLDRPGKYTIRVSRPEPFVEDEKGESPVIRSNSITIQITS